VEQQRTTLQGVIGVAFVVAGLVVALFFVLLTLERARLYAVLKALGTATPKLFAGLAVQAVVIPVSAFAVGAAAAAGLLALVPAGVPVVVLLGRVAVIGCGLVATALVGSAVSLRRVARIEPAEAIG
jgi:putative ABC transport system permease protein